MQKIIILDFGSQTTQLIGRRVRELDTFCEILPYNKFPKDDPTVIGVILSGSPYSVHDPEAFKVDLSQFVGRIPVLGICYGAQFISHTLGGRVEKADSREYEPRDRRYHQSPVPRLRAALAGVDVAWRHHHRHPLRLPGHRLYERRQERSFLLPPRLPTLNWYLGCPVPPRGVPHPAGYPAVEKLRCRHLRLETGVVGSIICRQHGGRTQGPAGQRPCHPRTLRRC